MRHLLSSADASNALLYAMFAESHTGVSEDGFWPFIAAAKAGRDEMAALFPLVAHMPWGVRPWLSQPLAEYKTPATLGGFTHADAGCMWPDKGAALYHYWWGTVGNWDIYHRSPIFSMQANADSGEVSLVVGIYPAVGLDLSPWSVHWELRYVLNGTPTALDGVVALRQVTGSNDSIVVAVMPPGAALAGYRFIAPGS